MTKDGWFLIPMALASAAFLAIGIWAYAIAGRFELIVIGMVGFGLLVGAERQRRAYAASASSQPDQGQ